MATIKFYATEVNASSPGGMEITHEVGSGLGFFGGGYNVSVPIGGYQDSTWLTNSDGTSVERVQLHNTKRASLGTVSIDGTTAISLENLPNNKCPLNVRFEHDEAVRVQNCKLRIFDRNNISNHASGVSTSVYEARHPSNDQAVADLNYKARSENEWFEFDPIEEMSDMPVTSSPGVSGVNSYGENDATLGYQSQEGITHASQRHDWYFACSVTPDQIGSKLFGLYFSAEYL